MAPGFVFHFGATLTHITHHGSQTPFESKNVRRLRLSAEGVSIQAEPEWQPLGGQAQKTVNRTGPQDVVRLIHQKARQRLASVV